jgi:hypothetical protein
MLGVLLSSSVLEACLRRICNAVFVVEFKVSRGIVSFSSIADGQCGQ